MKNTRTRWLYAVGAPVACAAVVIVGTVAANAAMSPRNSAAPAAELQFAAPATTSAAPKLPASDRSSAPDEAAPKPIGDVIETGIAAKTGKWVFYATAINEKAIPKTHFGIMAGRQLDSGELTSDVMANEAEGSDLAPGFHAVQGSMVLEAGKTPTFGYYVGAATKITATAGGKTVTAKQAKWSEDPSVVVFWFAPSTSGVSKLAAYDSAGKKLTTGHSGVGVG
jgi:hypothetical protein